MFSSLSKLLRFSLTSPTPSRAARSADCWVGIRFASSQVLLVQPRSRSEAENQESHRLVETYAGKHDFIEVGAARQRGGRNFSGHPATHFGKGTVDSLKSRIEDASTKQVIVDATLSGVQLRNLEAAWGVSVLDRVGLIIEIFAQRARTREARLQVELAALEHRGSRLVRGIDATGQRSGFGSGDEVVSARQRGASGSGSGGLGGGSGAGESELQLQRQRLRHRRKALQMRIAEVQRTRKVQRSGRRNSGKPVVAVVGYTNAGKSSLIEALTGKSVGSEDKLFATLDTTMRSVFLPSGGSAILSDTVGFINNLPTQLLTAFKGTLEEVVHADLLLHVVDAASPQARQQHDTVIEVLRSLGISDQQLMTRMITVHNKVDLLQPSQPEVSETHARGQVDDNDCDARRSGSPPPISKSSFPTFSPQHGESLCSRQSGQQQHVPNLDPTCRSTALIGSSDGESVKKKLPSHICLEPPLMASALTEEGLLQLLQEVDRKVSFRTGLDMLSQSTRVIGRRLLQQNVVGPHRPLSRRQRARQEAFIADEPWQPTWNARLKPSLAHHVFLDQ